MKYRAEIDGLRALAVVPVILFHAGFELFSGGFVGVDIFFVISGYLITTILIEDIENNRFSLVNFYERRSRRILPALSLVMLSTFFVGYFVLTPYFLRDLSQMLVAVGLFASNILLYIKSGYFSPISELKPLLHTWSLAVEEQFYVLFPLFLAFVWRFGKNRVFWIIVVFAVISLALSEWGWRNSPRGNFYLAPTRVWELLAGSMAAFVVQKRGVQANNVFSIFGLAAIIFSIFAYDESTPFPSVYALVPVIGVVLLVLFASEKTLVAKLLGTKVFVGVGLISYSAYLWHQPVLSMSRHLVLSELSWFLKASLVALTFLFAYVTWKYVENPFRNKSIVSSQKLWFFSIFTIMLMISLGFYGHKSMGFPNRFDSSITSIAAGAFDKNPHQKKCHYREDFDSLSNACKIGASGGSLSFAILGDSHADALAYSLSEKASNAGWSGYNFAFSGCSPLKFDAKKLSALATPCYQEASSFILADSKISTVILASRWTSMLTGIGFGAEITDSPREPYSGEERKILSAYLSKKVRDFIDSGKQVVLIYPIPEAGVDVPNYVAKRRILADPTFELTTSVKQFKHRNQVAIELFDSWGDFPNLIRVKPSEIFCNTFALNQCVTAVNDRSLYYDDDHLSNYGASFVIKNMFSKINAH